MKSRNPEGWLFWTLVSLLVASNLLGSVYWTHQNVLFVGHDSTSYMNVALGYRDFLYPLTPQSIFRAFTEPDYRPPALYIAAQPFFAFFGPDMDGGQMLNIAVHALVILLTVVLGWQVTGRWSALFAGALVAFLPMMTAMARLFYTEMLLTAAVALNLLALYKCEAFSRRGWSLVWGVSLGIGMLVKWTIPPTVIAPALWVVWTARRELRPAGWRLNRRAAALASIAAILFAVLWYAPNRLQIGAFPLGDWLAVGWLLLAWTAAYFVLVKPTRAANLAAGMALALLVGSLWYMPRYDIVHLLLELDRERATQDAGIFNFSNYRRYGRYLYNTHLGPLLFWVAVPATLLPWLWTALVKHRWLERRADLLVISIAATVLALTLIAQGNHRNLVPLTPQAAILIAIAFRWYARPLRWLLCAITLVVLFTQWFLITTDRFAPFLAQSAALWVEPSYTVPPASGLTDPAYWVGPELLETITADADDRQTLAMLVNTSWLHRGHLRYLMRTMGRDLNLVDLTEDGARWQDVISSAWVAVKTGDQSGLDNGARQATVDRILQGDALFESLYRLVQRWEAPNGESVLLYHRDGPGLCCQQHDALVDWYALADAVRASWSEQASLVYGNVDLAVLVGRFDPMHQMPVILDNEDGDGSSILRELDGPIFVVMDAGESHVANWLEDHAYKAREWGGDDGWVTVYGAPSSPLEEIDVDAQWGDLRLHTMQGQTEISPGAVIPLRVTTTGGAPPNAKWSVRLLDESGAVLAGADRPLGPDDHFGLFVPPDAPAGRYNVVGVAYDPATLAPIVDQDGAETVPLFDVSVGALEGAGSP